MRHTSALRLAGYRLVPVVFQPKLLGTESAFVFDA